MVAHARRRILVLVLLGFGFHAWPAQADPIVITGGLIDANTPGVQITGADTLLAATWVFVGGQLVNLSRDLTAGISFATPVTWIVNGTTFNAVLAGTLRFSATTLTSTPPPLDEPFAPFALSMPFEMSGQFSGFMQTPGQGTPLFSIALTGSGVTTVSGWVNTSWFTVEAPVEAPVQAPVPEPASILLAAIGAAGLCGMRSRGRRERSR